MKKNRTAEFCLGILISLILLESMARIVSPILGPPIMSWNTMQDAKILKLEQNILIGKNIETVVLGNSTALMGINPNIVDAQYNNKLQKNRTFNAAMNGSDISNMNDFATRFIIPKIRPKKLILFFSNTSMMSAKTCKNSNSNNPWLEKYSFLYKYRNTFRDPMILNTFIRFIKYRNFNQGIVNRWADNLELNGYSKYPLTVSSIEASGWTPKKIKITDELMEIDKSDLGCLNNLINFAKKFKSELIIGTVPLPVYDKNYRSFVFSVANAFGLRFIQGNNALGEGKYFQDGVHLNRIGSEVFSEFVGKELAKN